MCSFARISAHAQKLILREGREGQSVFFPFDVQMAEMGLRRQELREQKVRVHMNAVPRRTQMVEQRINSDV